MLDAADFSSQKLLILLTIANGTPVLAKKICGNRFSGPIDGGHNFVDGRPFLGPAKTIRGILASVASAAAPLLGLEAASGASLGAWQWSAICFKLCKAILILRQTVERWT
jgi:hypothetical protein